MIAFIGMETSGALRRRFQARGIETYSCDLLPSEDGGEEMVHGAEGMPLGRHMIGDVFQCLDNMWANDMWPEIAVFHPDCTCLTGSAAWASKDGPHHQRVKPGTLVGAARREARERSLADVQRIFALPIARKVVENPVGAISQIRKPTQIVQPYQFGDDASKKTCLWLDGVPPLTIDPGKRVAPRIINGLPRWANQTDRGQNRLSPGAGRWKDRARTYPGIADAIVEACLR